MEENGTMIFQYEDYFRACCSSMLIESVFLLFLLLPIVSSLIKRILQGSFCFEDDYIKILGIVVFVFMLSMCIGRLITGGIFLLKEKEEDSVEICGTIEIIEELNRFNFSEMGPMYREYRETKEGSTYGYQLQVSGTKMKLPVLGEFLPGDMVRVRYLPKSGYVLSIEKWKPE